MDNNNIERDNDRKIIERIIKIRKDANLSMSQFADKLNLSRSTISLAERGERAYTLRTRLDICEKFNVNYDWLLTGEGEMYKETAESVLWLLQKEYELDELDIEIVQNYVELSPIERSVFKEYIKKIKSGKG